MPTYRAISVISMLLPATVFGLVAGSAQSVTAKLGNGPVKVGLVLPLSADGPLGAAGRSFKNAAEMALTEAVDPEIQILVEDNGGGSGDTKRAVQQALDEGAEIVLGPILADWVRAATPVVRTYDVPMLAFSNDLTVAMPGVYLLGPLPRSEVDRIVGYAASSGKRALAALLPDNPYGRAVEAEFRDAVAREGVTLVALERYPETTGPTRDIAEQLAKSPVDAILLADRSAAIGSAAQSLKDVGIDLQKVQLMGTSIFYEKDTFADQTFQGAWFAAADVGAYPAFASRYQERFSEAPPENAMLAYDAVALVHGLDKQYGPRRFSTETLTDPSGFAGLTGLFRFRRDGTNERGLYVYRIAQAGAEVVSAAPQQFSAE
jgi:ABC-type branched-subunit amino acid transport system substrate-binding protein